MLVGGALYLSGKSGWLFRNDFLIARDQVLKIEGEYSDVRVYVAITGDLFHHGHVAFLKRAKTL